MFKNVFKITKIHLQFAMDRHENDKSIYIGIYYFSPEAVLNVKSKKKKNSATIVVLLICN